MKWWGWIPFPVLIANFTKWALPYQDCSEKFSERFSFFFFFLVYWKNSVLTEIELFCPLSFWLRQWRICLQCRRPGFDPWVGKIPWRRGWLPTPIFLAGESHGQRCLIGYSPWDCKESDMTEPWIHKLSFLCHNFLFYWFIIEWHF